MRAPPSTRPAPRARPARAARRLLLAALLATAACVTPASPAAPNPADTGSSDIVTVRFTTPGGLRLTADLRFVPADPADLWGELHVPPGAGPFPVVVLMHGCAGPSVVDRSWALALKANGYAAFRVDSFAGRGLREVCTDAFKLTPIQRIPDAYGALAALAGKPRVDARRAALMGFSHGGLLALGADTTWARQRYAPVAGPAFRAFVAFYPSCGFVFPERATLAGPLRIHVGDMDDWTPAAPCAELTRELKAAGQDAELTLYRGARHGFDAVGVPMMSLPDVDNPAACAFRAPSILGPLNPAELTSCLRKGATSGWDADATARARRIVLEQLAALLR